jgi:hypothetical protein
VYLQKQAQVDWLASAGINNYKQRTLYNNVVNTSATHFGQQYMVRMIYSKAYARNDVKFIPQLNANTVYLYNNAYFANGTTAVTEAIGPGVVTLGAGFKLMSVYKRENLKVIPELRCIVFCDVLSAGVNALPAYVIGGPALRTSTTPPRAAGQFGVSITTDVYRKLNCLLSYDLLVRSYYFNNVVSLKLRYPL